MSRVPASSRGPGLAVVCALGSTWVIGAIAGMTTAQPSSGAEGSASTALQVPDITTAFIRMLLVLGAVCIALVGVLWWLRRRGLIRPGGARAMKVVDSLRLGPGRELLLVEVAGRYQLLGISGDRITMLTSEPLDAAGIEERLTSSGIARRSVATGREAQPSPSFASVFQSVPAKAPPPASEGSPA